VHGKANAPTEVAAGPDGETIGRLASAQTLRQYDRVGLVSPGRTPAGGRRYSLRDVAELREVARLSALGIGLEGVRRILELENHLTALQQRVAELQAEVDSFRAAERRTSLVVWRPQPRAR